MGLLKKLSSTNITLLSSPFMLLRSHAVIVLLCPDRSYPEVILRE